MIMVDNKVLYLYGKMKKSYNFEMPSLGNGMMTKTLLYHIFLKKIGVLVNSCFNLFLEF